MFQAKFLLVVIVTLCLSVSDFHFEAYGDASRDVIPSPTACLNYPCQQVSTPPPPADYSIYYAPPPPHEKDKSKCPPAAGVQCCTPQAPPYNTYGYGPPNPYAPPNLYAPPNPYTYVPYGEGEASASVFLPILIPLVMLSSSFIFFF